MVKTSKLPDKCPLATWRFPEGFDNTKDKTVVFDIDKINCSCCFPAYMLRYGKNSNCSCPEVRTDTSPYTDCEIFSQWFWRGKYQNNNYKKNNNKRNPLDSKLRHECFKRDGYKCLECGTTNKEKTLHCDHIIPVSQGGSDELDNLQTLCEGCNLAKSNKKWIGGEDDRTNN